VPIMRLVMIYETVNFDREKYIAAYHRHHADVRRYFAARPNDLTAMNLVERGDGWDKQWPFLDLPIPSEPFPIMHAREGSQSQRARFSTQ
jgi:hypothetical protein